MTDDTRRDAADTLSDDDYAAELGAEEAQRRRKGLRWLKDTEGENNESEIEELRNALSMETLMRKTYVLIFAFDEDGNVLLRKKTHPREQSGCWNGLGGGIESRDTKRDFRPAWVHAAEREFFEEAGVFIPIDKLMGPITIQLHDADLITTWANLDDEELAHCRVGFINPPGPRLDEEYNRWFNADEINDMANQDWEGGGLVTLTWELLELIKQLREPE
jgi:8-oxo-dGTP pyrophosphatase MutT (NUDIX family)